MRRRFFLIVFMFLVAAIFVVSTLQIIFFESERSRLIDQRLETIASSLFASGLSSQLINNLESTDDLVHDLLGEERVDHIINIYSLSGEILAQNYTGSEIPLTFSPSERWQTYAVKDRTVRVLNIQSGELLVQVGMILGPRLLRLSLFNSRLALFLVFVLGLLAVMAYFSSGVLFNPLRRLTNDLKVMSVQLDRKLGQPLSQFVIGAELTRFSGQGHVSKDEFELLCAEIRSFLRKLEDYTRSFHAQTAILTHELKTPLTILRNYLEEMKNADTLVRAKDLGQSALMEIHRLTKLINDYLQWSVLSSNPNTPSEIYAVKLSEMALKVVAELNSIHADRIRLEVLSDATLFAMPDHARQLLTNLLSNALNYSPPDRPVVCRVSENSLTIEDRGQGIPAEVIDHLGRPFNRGTGKSPAFKSSGLGLAWIHALCEKYGWKLKIDTSPQGTTIAVGFPP